jgi:urease accessory protein
VINMGALPTNAEDSEACAHVDARARRLASLRLLQLASPTLPIGAFAYSQGLEPAVAAGLVTDEDSAARWILGLLGGPMTYVDLPVFMRILDARCANDGAAADRWNAFLLASRPTAELQAEDRHLGSALARVLATLDVPTPNESHAQSRTFVGMFALSAAHWNIDARAALDAFAFTWAEAQTSAAVRLVPLGQSAGVRIVAQAARAIPAAVDRACALGDDDIGAAAPMQALLSTAHENQYSRLFRS